MSVRPQGNNNARLETCGKKMLLFLLSLLISFPLASLTLKGSRILCLQSKKRKKGEWRGRPGKVLEVGPEGIEDGVWLGLGRARGKSSGLNWYGKRAVRRPDRSKLSASETREVVKVFAKWTYSGCVAAPRQGNGRGAVGLLRVKSIGSSSRHALKRVGSLFQCIASQVSSPCATVEKSSHKRRSSTVH